MKIVLTIDIDSPTEKAVQHVQVVDDAISNLIREIVSDTEPNDFTVDELQQIVDEHGVKYLRNRWTEYKRDRTNRGE